MRTFLASLTAAVVGIHALLGCCWHHGHSCAQAGTTACTHENHGSAAHDARHETDHDDASHDHELPNSNQCHEAPCVFTAVSGPNYDGALPFAVWHYAQLDADTNFALYQPTIGRPAATSSAATLPMRLHLFKGLLLI